MNVNQKQNLVNSAMTLTTAVTVGAMALSKINMDKIEIGDDVTEDNMATDLILSITEKLNKKGVTDV